MNCWITAESREVAAGFYLISINWLLSVRNHLYLLVWSPFLPQKHQYELFFFFFFLTHNLPQLNQWTNYTTTMVLKYQEPLGNSPANLTLCTSGGRQTGRYTIVHHSFFTWFFYRVGAFRSREQPAASVCLFISNMHPMNVCKYAGVARRCIQEKSQRLFRRHIVKLISPFVKNFCCEL